MFLAALAVQHLSCLRDRGQLYAALDTLKLEFLSIIREFYACMVHVPPSLFTDLGSGMLFKEQGSLKMVSLRHLMLRHFKASSLITLIFMAFNQQEQPPVLYIFSM